MIDDTIKFKKKWSDEGVSEVIGTILMLAITVVLFSTIMVSVMALPAPQQTPNADFLATLKLQSGNTAYLNVTHIGGETLFSSSARIVVIKDVTDSVTYTVSEGGITDNWDIGETWSKLLSSITSSTRIEVIIADLDSNSLIWSSLVTGGQQSLYPQILQRWVDADPSTLTLDPIRVSDTTGFTFYVRVSDADYDLSDNGVYVDASSVGKSSHMNYARVSGGVWEFDFTSISDASVYDGKPLFIHAIDDAGHETIDSYILSVLQPDIVVNEGDTYYFETPPVGEEGLPSYLVYVHGDQGYVVLGENKTEPRTWGALANTSDPKFTFTQGEEWCFIRVGTKNLRNIDGKNTMEIRGIYSNELMAPPSNNSAFELYTISGPAYIYQAKFNTSLLSPGMYSIFIDLLSSAVEGATPARFQANFVLTILAPEGQYDPFMPTLKFYKEDRRVNPAATEWGTKTQPFDLSDVNKCIVWVEVGLQTIGVASAASIKDVRLTDMRARANLYGDAPTGDGMISSVGVDSSNKVYYISIDLRLRNGVTYTSGLSAYSLTLGQISDVDEGIYTISLPLWIRSSAVSRNFVVATDGFGFGSLSGTDNFIHSDYIFHIDNNKFFTTRVIDSADEDPGKSSVISPYLCEYFDMDEDGDRDVLVATTIRGVHYLVVYINRMNEYGIWEPRSIFSNYTDGNEILSMAHGDVDNDGDEDWIVSTSAGKVYLYLNDYPIKTKTIFTTGDLRYFREMRLADITGDGRADLIAIGYSSSVARGDKNCRLYLYNLTRNGAVTTSPYDLGNYPETNRDIYDFDIGDIDGDDDIDIAVVADYAHSGYGVRWYERTETETDPGALATADPVSYTGTRVSGTYTNTQSSDNSYEVIQESSGSLDYAWPIATISGERATLYFEARMSAGADENFYVYYGKTATGPWVFMFMVPSTTTVDTTYSFNLPAGTSGTIYVRVTDGSSAGSSDDSIYVDRINVRGVTAVSYSTLHGLYASTSYIAIGVGDMNGMGNLDVAVAKGSAGAGGEIVVINGTSGVALTTIAYATLAPTGDTFVVRDTNGDGRAEIVSVQYANSDITCLRMWLNLGDGTSFSNILIKDFYASYGNKGGQTIKCINVENQYGE